ncbi:MAG: hydantoinase/oxoprolinase family protein [Fuerstiella sp.]
MNVLGLDIGGANIKIADADGNTVCLPFPMWTQHRQLAETLQGAGISVFSAPDLVTLTMTAELADCFQTKAEGVRFVIKAVQQAFPEVPLRVWLTSGEFAEPEDAMELPELVAAANWHALATWVGRAVPDGPALLVDVGSTTTDIIPLLDGCPVPGGCRDIDRLRSGELVYTGSRRTPLCAVVQTLPIQNTVCRVAAEQFATIIDAFVVTGLLPEDPTDTETADGRPLTRQNSLNRLAHMVCCDATELDEAEIVRMAEAVLQEQMTVLTAAARAVLQQLDRLMQQTQSRSLQKEQPVLLLSGSGAFLGLRLAEQLTDAAGCRILSLPDMSGPDVSEAACAFAVACLGHDLCQDDLLETTAF